MHRSALLVGVGLALLGSGCKRLGSWTNGRHPGGEFRSDAGRYTVDLPAGKLATRNWTENGVHWRMDAAGNDTVGYGVSYADIPPGGSFEFDAGMAGVTQRMGGRSYWLNGGTGGPDDWRDFEVEGTKEGYVSGRTIIIRKRVYLILALGPNARRASPEVQTFVNSFRLTDGAFPWQPQDFSPRSEVRRPPSTPAPVTPTPTPTPPPVTSPSAPPRGQIYGGDFDPEFRDVAPAGGYLVGFDVGYRPYANYDIIGTIRPVYGVGDRYELGQQHGPDVKHPIRVLAKPGYAVGAMRVKYGGAVDGLQVVFMKADANRLDATDSYTSEWVGGPGGIAQVKLGGDGTPIIGIIGKKNSAGVSGIAVVFRPSVGR